MKYLAILIVFLFVQTSFAQTGRYKGNLNLKNIEYIGGDYPDQIDRLVKQEGLYYSKIKIDYSVLNKNKRLRTEKYDLTWRKSKNKITALKYYPEFSLFRSFIFEDTYYSFFSCRDRTDTHKIVKSKKDYILTLTIQMVCDLNIGLYNTFYGTRLTYQGKVKKN